MQKKQLVSHLSSDKFSEFISDKKSKLVIIDFFADWCGPCVMMAPVFERLASRNPSVKFGKVNVDDNGDLANEYEVSSIPCLVFFKDGKEVDRIVGSLAEDLLSEKIGDYIREFE